MNLLLTTLVVSYAVTGTLDADGHPLFEQAMDSDGNPVGPVPELLSVTRLPDGSLRLEAVPDAGGVDQVDILDRDRAALVRILDSALAESALPADQRLGFTRKFRNDPNDDNEPYTIEYRETEDVVVLSGLLGIAVGSVRMSMALALNWRDELANQLGLPLTTAPVALAA